MKTPAEQLGAIREATVGVPVARVRPAPNGVWWTITLEDGASFRLSADAMTELALGVGVVWTEEMVRRALDLHALSLARTDAMRLVQRRAVTRRKVEDALRRKGHASTSIVRAVEALERVGLIDDARSAEERARSLASRGGIGQRVVEQKLRAHGVRPEMAKEAAARAMEGRDPMEDALAFARKRVERAGSLEREVLARRVGAALARRGFDADVCREASTRAIAERYDAS